MSLSVVSCQTADSTFFVHTSKVSELKGLNQLCDDEKLKIYRNGQTNKQKNFFTRFWFCELFLPFLVPVYYKVVFRPFNYGSFDVRTDNVLLAVWQLADFKDILSK